MTEPEKGTLAPLAPHIATLSINDRTLHLNRDQVELLKRTVCRDSTDDELGFFLAVASRTGLDPFVRQIHAVKRWSRENDRWEMAIQTGIDGYRLIAHRTGQMNGQDGPFWCGPDGVWKDVWLSDEPPVACKVVVWRKGHDKPYTGIARYNAYVQRTKEGVPNRFWKLMPDNMIAKCSESLALRKAFPAELAGIFTNEEMEQADNEPGAPPQRSQKTSRRGDAVAGTAAEGPSKPTKSPKEAALEALQKNLIIVLRKATGAADDAAARAHLEALANVDHESKMSEEDIRDLGKALHAIGKGAKLEEGMITVIDSDEQLWPRKQAKKKASPPPKEEPPPAEPAAATKAPSSAVEKPLF
jgi:phage recombination protein Bet